MAKTFKLTRTLRNHLAMVLLCLFLALCAITFYMLGLRYPGNRDIFMNLSTDMVGTLIVVFFVDQLIKRNNDTQWARAREIAVRDIVRLADELAGQLTFFVAIPFTEESTDHLKKLISSGVKFQYRRRAQIKWNLRKISEIGVDELLVQLSPDMWKGLGSVLSDQKEELHKNITLYGPYLPPKVLAELWNINRLFFQHGYASLYSVPYAIEDDDHGKKRILPRNFPIALDNYLKQVTKLYDVLEEIGWTNR